MKNKKLLAFIIALSFLLTGCNINGNDPEITQSGNSEFAETSLETVYTDPEETVNTAAANSTAAESTEPSGTSVETTEETGLTDTTEDTVIQSETDASTAAETSVTTTTVVTEPPATQPPVTEPPATQPPVVQTDPPIVTTTTAEPVEPSPPTIYSTTADGVLTFTNEKAVIDYSHSDDGYVMTKYMGSNSVVKVQVVNPDGSKNQVYTINTNGVFEAIPLTRGNGEYTIMVCEAVGTKFAVVNSGKVNVSLASSLAPFLRPSNYVPYSYGDSAVTKASQLCGGAANDLEKVDRVYSWLVDNVTYDSALASSVQVGYVPDTEKVINRKIGICLDYAGTMAAMLRSQNIPVQVISGNVSGTNVLHAWVNVYVTDVGWVYGAIYFDGTAWHRMDPTYASSSKSSSAILQYIGDGSNYTPKYVY